MRLKYMFAVAMFLVVTASAQMNLSESDFARLIATVKNTAVSEFDSSLPAEPFDQWVRKQLPDDVSVAYAVITPSHGVSDEGDSSMPWVEVDVSKEGQPVLAIVIACYSHDGNSTTRPKVRSIDLFKGRKTVELSQLREIRPALTR